MDENRFRIMGRTGLKVGRLVGVACSHGAPTAAFGYITRNAMNFDEMDAEEPNTARYRCEECGVIIETE